MAPSPSVTFPLILQIKRPMHHETAVFWYIGPYFGCFCPVSGGDVPCFFAFLWYIGLAVDPSLTL